MRYTASARGERSRVQNENSALGMGIHTDLRDIDITYLENAHAMARQIEEQLEHQVKETQRFPDIQMRIQEHLDATRQHRERMAQCLESYHHKPSTVTGALTGMVGNSAGTLGGARIHPPAKTGRDDYMIEHMEIAAYEPLTATAQLCGDTTTVRACRRNLADEVRMVNWLRQNLGKTAIRSQQHDGIAVDQQAMRGPNDVAARGLRSARSDVLGQVGVPPVDRLDQSTQPSGTI
jgi:ferritin-like metal-binding protein YciE